MTTDTFMSEKVRRRLVPMILDRRIGEPAVTRAEAFEGSDPAYIVTVRTGDAAHQPANELLSDVSRALADLGPGIIVSIDAA